MQQTCARYRWLHVIHHANMSHVNVDNMDEKDEKWSGKLNALKEKMDVNYRKLHAKMEVHHNEVVEATQRAVATLLEANHKNVVEAIRKAFELSMVSNHQAVLEATQKAAEAFDAVDGTVPSTGAMHNAIQAFFSALSKKPRE